jgi:hypothetical protein
LTREHFESAPVGRISNDFDVREFEREEEEREAEDKMTDVVSSDSDDSDDDNGGTDARATPVGPMPAPVPVEVLHAMPTQGRLVHDLPKEDTPYDSWGRIYVPPPPCTAAELMKMREGNLPFSGVPNYRDVSMAHMTVCDTGLQMCSHSLYNHEDGGILRKGMVFSTMAEMKLFL